MFIAMNHLRVDEDKYQSFIDLWDKRKSYLSKAPGFALLEILEGPSYGGAITYVVQSTWDSRDAFYAWRESDLFTKANLETIESLDLYVEPARFEEFEELSGGESSQLLNIAKWTASHASLGYFKVGSDEKCKGVTFSFTW